MVSFSKGLIYIRGSLSLSGGFSRSIGRGKMREWEGGQGPADNQGPGGNGPAPPTNPLGGSADVGGRPWPGR